MQINTAELKNNLSRYIHRVCDTGESITICERNRPVATLKPLRQKRQKTPGWEEERRALLAKAKRLGITLRTATTQKPMRKVDLRPEVARDGRTDVSTIEWLRGGRSY